VLAVEGSQVESCPRSVLLQGEEVSGKKKREKGERKRDLPWRRRAIKVVIEGL
jgi:hypothetical protein